MPDAPTGQRSRSLQWVRGRLGRGPGAGDAATGVSGGERSLRKRVEELEEEMQEARRLNRRLAELMDVVEELLVPLSQRDEEKVRQYLDSHSTVL